jgi:hypothetical protein
MLKKITLFSLMSIFTLGIVLLPQSTFAVVPDGDDAQNTAGAVSQFVGTGFGGAAVGVEKILKGIAIGIADQMLAKVSNDIISWSNNGFDGEPGFINNYSDLIRGVEFDAISSSFEIASGIAQSAQTQNNQSAQSVYDLCAIDAETNQAEAMDLLIRGDSFADSEALIEYNYEYDLVQCTIEISTNQSIDGYNTCSQTNTQAANDYAIQIMSGPTAQFFEDFFGGDASTNNEYFADFSTSEQLAFNADAQLYYIFMYTRNQCFDNLRQSSTAGDAGQTAQNNHDLYQSGKVNSTRAVAKTVADFGANKLNDNQFEQLARGGGDLTLALLGSQGRKDDFKNDITAGGWDGILSLTGEGSTDLTLATSARVLVGNKAQQEVALKEFAINLPTKFLDRTRCDLYKKDENGNNTDECLREVAVTPGGLVANQVTDAVSSGARRGESFGDDLVALLVEGLGDTIGGLVDGGFGSLTNAAVGSFFNTNDSSIQNVVQGSSGTDFQSQFNVLGIETSTEGTFAGAPLTNTPVQESINTIPSGIGGPEDPNPQIIINFQEELERNISMATEERSHYNEIRDLTTGVADVIFEFERCIPGPDYEWEIRLNDVADTQDDQTRLAINEMKTMVRDPQITIPGGVEMRDQITAIFDTTRQNKASTEFRRQQLNRVINTMSFIKSDIQADFNSVKGNFNENLVLFEEDWDSLSNTQKTSILTYLVDNQFYINPVYVLEGGSNVLSEQALADDETKIKTAAITQSWNIWRSTADAEEKLELRETFYALQNDLSNRQFVTIARTQFNEMRANIENSYAIALDCMVFKAYALGQERSTILDIVNNQNQELEDKIVALADIINSYNPEGVDIGTNSSGLFDNSTSGNIPGFNIDTARSDNELKTFLESEETLQLDNEVSVFATRRMTLSSMIQSSIFGFNSEIEKQEYFDTYYPEDWITHEHTGNRLSVSEIYKYDIMRYIGERGGNGLKGSLFCRIPGYFDRFGSSDGDGVDDTSLCFNGMWYPISRLSLQLLVSEINT